MERIVQFINKIILFFLGKLLPFLPVVIRGKIQKIVSSTSALNAIVLFSVNALITPLSMITGVWIVNALGKEEFGLYSYFIAIAGVMATIVLYGRDITMVRDLVQSKTEEEFCGVIGGTIVLSCFLLAICWVALGLGCLFLHLSFPVTFWIIALGTILASFDLQPVYDAWRKISKHTLYVGIGKALYFLPIWIFLIFFSDKFTIFFIALILLISQLVVLLIEYKEVRRTIPLKIFCFKSVRTAKKQARVNFLFALTPILLLIFGPLITVILKSYCGESEVGLYGTGALVMTISVFAMNQISRVGYPSLAKDSAPDIPLAKTVRTVKKFLIALILSSAPFAVALICIPSLITRLFFKPEFAPVAQILPLLGIRILFWPFSATAYRFLIASACDRSLFISYLVGAAAAWGLCFLWIPKGGFVGATWAYVVSTLIPEVLIVIITLIKLFEKRQHVKANSSLVS